VLEAITRVGRDVTVADAVFRWEAEHPHIQVTRCTGLTYP